MSDTDFLDTVAKATADMRTLFPETPLQKSKLLSERYDADIYLKREDLTPVRSYKIRGAFYFMSLAMKNGAPSTFVCASAGNHAQGFAFCCARFEVPGVVFMPITTPSQKIEKTKVFGGKHIEVQLIGDTFDEAAAAAKKYCAEQHASFVPPFDHADITTGQATVAHEICEKMTPDIIIAPVGGGGLSAGFARYLAAADTQTALICCEPAGAPSLTKSLAAGELAELSTIDTFVDGAAVKCIGAYTFGVLKKHLKHPVQLVPESRLCQTLIKFLNHEGIVLEPAGGLAIDALRDMTDEIRGKKVVCIVSGGNFDFERLPEVKERAMRYAGTKKYFVLRMPQRPGALKEFLSLLGPRDDIARFEYLKKSARDFGSVLIGIETSDPANFDTLFVQMSKRGFGYSDVTDDAVLADFLI